MRCGKGFDEKSVKKGRYEVWRGYAARSICGLFLRTATVCTPCKPFHSSSVARNYAVAEIKNGELLRRGRSETAACYNDEFTPWGRSSVVEQRPFKPKVVGSIPTAPTKPIDSDALISPLSTKTRVSTN